MFVGATFLKKKSYKKEAVTNELNFSKILHLIAFGLGIEVHVTRCFGVLVKGVKELFADSPISWNEMTEYIQPTVGGQKNLFFGQCHTSDRPKGFLVLV